MNTKSRGFKAVDILLLVLTVLPMVCAMVIKVLTKPYSEGMNIAGAQIFFTLPMPVQDLPITEAQINSWLLIISVLFLCLYLTHGLSVKHPTKRQRLLEWAVGKVEAMVRDNMGEYFKAYVPFICAIFAISALSSLMSLLGLFPPTSDINIVAGWAILIFILITYYKFKLGPLGYLKSFTQPVAVVTPFNIISEVATPVSMAFRHYGNVLSGTIVSALLAFALQNLSSLIFGSLPGFLGEFPFMQIGIPALLSVYFDVFSGCLQAYIFAMLTMLYVADAFPQQEYFERLERKKKEKMKESKA